jgi:hypothetical protein
MNLKQSTLFKLLLVRKYKMYFSAVTVCEVLSVLKDNEHLRAIKLFGADRCIEISLSIAQLPCNARHQVTLRHAGYHVDPGGFRCLCRAASSMMCLKFHIAGHDNDSPLEIQQLVPDPKESMYLLKVTSLFRFASEHRPVSRTPGMFTTHIQHRQRCGD